MTSKVVTPVRVVVLDNAVGLPLPEYKHKGDAGFDFRAAIMDQELQLAPGYRAAVPTGLKMKVLPGFEIQVRPRSGMALNHGLIVVNSPGTIDASYTGEIMVILGNQGNDVISIKHGDRIAQGVIAPVMRGAFHVVDNLEDTTRGENGFGSTGKQ